MKSAVIGSILLCLAGVQSAQAQNTTYSGELKYKFGDNIADSLTFETSASYQFSNNIVVQSALHRQDFGSDWPTIRGGDVHLSYVLGSGVKAGAYYQYEQIGARGTGIDYWGVEGMFRVGALDLEARLGRASTGDGSATSVGLTGYYEINPETELSGGYVGIFDDSVDDSLHRGFARISYGGLIPKNGVKLFGEVSYTQLEDFRERGVGFGVEWDFGTGRGSQRSFSRPRTILDF